MKKQLLFIGLIFFKLFDTNAQSTNNAIIGPSPNAAAFDKYGNVPVSTYTGVPEISIPLYTLINKQVKVPVSLSYYAGGIKVSEDASRIGLGWVLNCGGVINRSVRGIDDFNQRYGYLVSNNHSPEIFDAGSTQNLRANYTNLSTPDGTCDKNIAGETVNLSEALPAGATDPYYLDDLEPDVFTYNFLGYTGKFAISKTNNIISQAPSNLRFKLMVNDGSVFQVTTPDGNKLTFDKIEYTQVHQPEGQNYISSWYLTKIVSVTGAEIDFHYTSGQGSSIQTPIYEHQDSNNIFIRQENQNGPEFFENLDGSGWAGTTPNTSQYDIITLDSVSSTLGSVILNYSDRIDVLGDKRIVSIRLHNYKTPQNDKIYVLNQGYFSSTDYNSSSNIAPAGGGTYPNAQTLYQNRLQLQSISQQNVAGQNLGNYIFSYNATMGNKGSFACDYWGFYNGTGGSTSIPLINYYNYANNIATYTQGSNRNPDATASQDCLLKQIQYPAGGITKFDYESNDFDIGNSVNTASYEKSPDLQIVTAGELTRIGSDGTFTIKIPFVNANTGVNVLIQSQNGQSPISQPYPTPIPGAAYLEVFAPGSTTPLANWDLSYEGSWTIPNGGGYLTYANTFTPTIAGTYTFKSHFLASETFLNYINIQASTTFDQNVTSNHNIGLGGGVRIKRITDIDPVTGVSSIRKFIYHYQLDANGDGVPEEYSYGKRLSNLKFTHYDYKNFCSQKNPDESAIQSDQYLFTIGSTNVVSSLNPIVGYSQVTVLDGENGENGKTEYHYQNNLDFDLTYTGQHLAAIPDLRPVGISGIADLSDGTLLEKIDYKYDPLTGNYSKLKDVNYTYSSSDPVTQIGIKKISPQIWNLCGYIDCSWVLAGYPAFESSWTHPRIETSDDYIAGTNTYIRTTTNYLYESTPTHYQPIKTTISTSADKIINNVVTYPSDYASGTPFIDNMVTSNVVKPIENVIFEVNNGLTNIVSGQLTTYKAGGQGLEDVQSAIETTFPITLSTYKFSNKPIGQVPDGISGAIFAADNHYSSRISYSYDTQGNPTQIQKINGISVSYLWGYNKTYPIAQVANAKSNDVFYDSFEEGDGNSTSGDAKSGHFSHATGTYTKSLSGLDAGSYVLSYWSKSATTGLWSLTFVPESVSGTTFTISLSGQIDDVRFYPSNAQMTTYTYDPLVGMTSSTDAKDETTYFEYDSFQRLMNIKDKDGNIIKHMDYHYQGQ